MHPLGKEPTAENERLGPDINFHLEAPVPGVMKLFAQVIVKGQEIYVPFGIFIKEVKSD